jgi:hemerythrin-like domain-containing protein
MPTTTKRSPATTRSTTSKSPAAKKAAKKSSATTKKAAKKSSAAAKKAAKRTSAATKKAAKKTSATTKGATKRATSPVRKATAKKPATTSARKTSAKRTTRKSTGTSSRPTDAIALLKQDHREIKDLFEKFEEAGPRAHATRETTVERIIETLSVHAGIEETVLYPEIRERIPAAEEDALEALEEHHVAKQTLAELQRMGSEDERFTAKVTVLIESVTHHIDEEEDELFAKVRKEFTRTELEGMAERLTRARTLAPKRPHPHAPDAPPANIVANIVAAPIDAAASAASSVVSKAREIVS